MISTRCPGSGWTGMRGLCLVPPGPLSPSIREPSLLAVLPPPRPPPSLPMALRVSTMVLLSALWAGGWGLRAPLPLMGLGLLNRQVGSRAPHPLLDSRTYPLGRCVWPAFVH